jgi:hypothetical protein
MVLTIRDVLTKLLVEADYPEVKREGFINTFYEYLFMKLLIQLEQSDPEMYSRLMEELNGKDVNDVQIQDVLAEIYSKPEFKEKVDKMVTEVTDELAGDVAKYASVDQKKQMLTDLPQ